MDGLMKKMDRLQTAIDAANGWEIDRQVQRATDALRCPPGVSPTPFPTPRPPPPKPTTVRRAACTVGPAQACWRVCTIGEYLNGTSQSQSSGLYPRPIFDSSSSPPSRTHHREKGGVHSLLQSGLLTWLYDRPAPIWLADVFVQSASTIGHRNLNRQPCMKRRSSGSPSPLLVGDGGSVSRQRPVLTWRCGVMGRRGCTGRDPLWRRAAPRGAGARPAGGS